MRVLILVAGLLLACSVPAGAADVLINNGLDCSNPGNVIDDAAYQSDRVYVRNVGCGAPDPWSPCLTPGAATEVCVELGGEVSELYVYDSSAVTINGGAVGQAMGTHDSSTVAMNGGLVYPYLTPGGSSSFTLNGGEVGLLSAQESSNVTMNDGEVEVLDLYDSSAVTLNGGKVLGYVDPRDSSTLIMNSGEVGENLAAWGSSTFTMNGGRIVSHVEGVDSAIINLNGGEVGDALAAGDLSTITITGTGFAVDGSPVPYGDLTAQTGTLTGRLLSGDPIGNAFVQGGWPGCTYPCTGTIRLAPPGYLVVPALSLSGKLLLGAALLGTAVTWRRRPRAA